MLIYTACLWCLSICRIETAVGRKAASSCMMGGSSSHRQTLQVLLFPIAENLAQTVRYMALRIWFPPLLPPPDSPGNSVSIDLIRNTHSGSSFLEHPTLETYPWKLYFIKSQTSLKVKLKMQEADTTNVPEQIHNKRKTISEIQLSFYCSQSGFH